MNYGEIYLNVVFCAGFLIQLIQLLNDTTNSTELYTEMRRVDGTSRPFPLTVIGVAEPAMNQTSLEEAGYSDYSSYYKGSSWYNMASIGWGGHTNGHKKMHADALVLHQKLTLWKNLSDVVSLISLLKMENGKHGKQIRILTHWWRNLEPTT